MLDYWRSIVRRAFTRSLDAIGQNLGAVVFAILALGIGFAFVWYRKGFEAMKIDIASTVIEVIGVAVLAWLPFFVYQLLKTPSVMSDEQEEAIRSAKNALAAAIAKAEAVRPYLVIAPKTPNQIRATLMLNADNKVLPEGAYDAGYMVLNGPLGDVLHYNVREASGRTAARNVQYHYSVVVLDQHGKADPVQIAPSTMISEVLVPDESIPRQVLIPKGTITGSTEPKGIVRVQVVVTYFGQANDQNQYFYKLVLNIRRVARIEDLRLGMGGLRVESTDEGIVTDLKSLIS